MVGSRATAYGDRAGDLGRVTSRRSARRRVPLSSGGPMMIEALESRRLLAVITVTNLMDEDGMGAPVAGSLRAAIIAANAAPGSTIDFDPTMVTGPIVLNADLPAITGAGTIIDGTTAANGVAEISGVNLPAAGSAIDVKAATVTLSALAIVNCGPMTTGAQATAAIILDTGSSADTVKGCFIGLLPNGTAGGNGEGIVITNGSNHDTIGGATAAARNVFGNNGAGADHGAAVLISDPTSLGTTANTVEGNYIGLDPTGLLAAADGYGVELSGVTGNTIDANYIAASNQTVAMGVRGGAGVFTAQPGMGAEDGNTVENNTIGLNIVGAAIPNDTGIVLGNAVGATSGDTVSGNIISDNTQTGVDVLGSLNVISANTIVSNGGTGVLVATTAERNTISQNSISLNGTTYGGDYDLGIDLGGDGVTLDTATSGTTATGANGLTPFPTLTLTPHTNIDTINIAITGNDSTEYKIELFGNTAATASTSGYGQGLTYLGSVTVTTNGTGTGNGTINLPVSSLSDDVTATATDISPHDAMTNPDAGATSEFAQNIEVPNAVVTTGLSLHVGAGTTLYEGHSTLDKTDAFFADTGGTGPYTVTVNYGDGTGLKSVPYNANDQLTLVHAYNGHVSQTYVATITVYTRTSATQHSFDVTVVNNAPHDLVVKSLSRAAATTSTPFLARATFLDNGAGNGDFYRVYFNYGDGTKVIAVTTQHNTFGVGHQYTHPGHYKLLITVIDDGGGQTTFSQVINVFAPTPAESK
jgi:parallel beta-helix repeat protein